MNRLCWFGMLLLATAGGVRAQAPAAAPPPDAPVQTARTELLLPSRDNEAHVQPLAADSSVVVLVGQTARSGKVTFTFQHYDQRLQLRHSQPVPVETEFHFARLCAEGRTVFALFTSGVRPGRLWAVAYDGGSGAIRTQQFETRLSREIVELKALESRLFATVLLADGQHVTALLLDLATGQMQYLPAVYELVPTQFSFVADAASQRAEYVLSQSNGRKSRLQLKQLSERGQLLNSEFVQAESGRSLITAQLSPPHDTAARLLTGTYSLRDPNYAQGLFATDLSATAEAHAPLRFYDFLHLKHFFDYLKPQRQARLRRRVERRTARAVALPRWHYRLLLHELLPQPDGGYVLLAEVYYPHYHYNNYGGGLGYTGGLGRGASYGPGLGSTRVFDGYQTTHILTCGFDGRGTLLWDNIFVVENLRRYDLEETVRAQLLADGRLALVYLDDDKLRYKRINQSAAAPDDLFVPLQTTPLAAPAEKIMETESADVLPWFGSRFIASGFQTIRAANGQEREVFFLNEVAF